jgi:hypothetical protein
MNTQDKFLLEQIYEHFSKSFSEEKNLIKTEEGMHTIRSSANYALAVLMQSGDTEKAARIIKAITECQYTKKGEVYYGTYKRALEELDPPSNPTVWDDYDPNWREFIATVFAVILSEYGNVLPEATVEIMKKSAYMAAAGSVERYLADDIPMNTNIELMHIFVTEFYGRLFGDEAMLKQSKAALNRLYEIYKLNNTVCEFNSTTYYGVDFIALSCIKKYSKDEELLAIADMVYEGLWRNLADFYSFSLKNPCGPYSRGYEMEMTEHSSIGAILYKNFGDIYKDKAGLSCESFTDPMIITANVQVPEHLKDYFIIEQPERLIEHKFTELCERHPKGGRHFLCTATAFISENFMMGALGGSQNTSGQLHPGTIFWKHEGELYWIRLSRRRPGGEWGEHFTGVYFNGQVDRDRFLCEIDLSRDKEIEVFLEMHGKNIKNSTFEGDTWKLPGLEVTASFNAGNVSIREAQDRLEIYAVYSGEKDSKMTICMENFKLAQ